MDGPPLRLIVADGLLHMAKICKDQHCQHMSMITSSLAEHGDGAPVGDWGVEGYSALPGWQVLQRGHECDPNIPF